jgi:NAD(P)-dependent dehydrogenase (short-subunit alcohol dehydrogenase family)
MLEKPTQEVAMEINGSVALVTGANRGLGRQLATQLVQRGAKVYAAARHPEQVDIAGAVPLQLDVTDPSSIAAAAKVATDVTLLVNNAGSSTGAALLEGDLDDIRLEMETHYFGTLNVTRAFAPLVIANGGGGVLNVLSALSWVHFPTSGAYSAAKAAEWALTNALRLELAPRGVDVMALHVGYMDTDMAASITAPKSDPAVIAALALDGVQAGVFEVVADDVSRQVRAGLSGELSGLYPQLVSI